MAARKRTANEEPAANGPADLGWTKKAVEPSGRTRAPVAGPPKGAQQAHVVPDPGITHGFFRVLQRTDGPFIVIDTRRPPGDQAVAIHRPPRVKDKEAPDPKKLAEEDAKARHAAEPKEEDPPS